MLVVLNQVYIVYINQLYFLNFFYQILVSFY
nr:MAG TPA: hypothetical protein [Bacteriophage sp.]DAI57868.1 MAG TPA: hypothetical protein [Caudoviricetes sp.]